MIKLDIFKNIFHESDPWCSLKKYGSKVAVIGDHHVFQHYAEDLKRVLSKVDIEPYFFPFPAGERSKTREIKIFLEDQMLEKKLGRDTFLISFGGGVSLDIGGYIASTYCRGIPLINIPTTLLAMVDASIGGKNGLNTPYGKNMIGTIYQPKKILLSFSFLKTLSERELKNGYVEMIKHAVVAEEDHFNDLNRHMRDHLSDAKIMEKVIIDSCRIKQEIVEQDEQENGKRRILNFGHTIGHALEKHTEYLITHGEAVAIGMAVESYMSNRLGFLDLESLKRVIKLLKDYGLPLKIPLDLSIDKMLTLMQSDKKSIGGIPRFVLIEQIGKCKNFHSAYCTHIPLNILEDGLNWMIHDLCSY